MTLYANYEYRKSKKSFLALNTSLNMIIGVQIFQTILYNAEVFNDSHKFHGNDGYKNCNDSHPYWYLFFTILNLATN